MHGLESRTNNFVESHNATLNKSIKNGSSLFTVVSKLLTDELCKVHDLRLVLDGNAGVYREPEAKYKNRSAFIKQGQKDLAENKITADGFLLRMTCHNNKINNHLARYDGALSSDDMMDTD